MNKNKGIIGLGLIVAIVLGIAVVSGGAYYILVGSKFRVDCCTEDQLKELNKNTDDINSNQLVPNNKENLVQDVKNNSTSNKLSLYKNDKLSFNYPSNWKIETIGTINDKNIQIILDPIKVFTPQEIKGLDVSMGMITFSINNDLTEKNSHVIGYGSFPTITIGVNNIKAKMFEKFYPKDAPEVSAQGEHNINYYIGENIKISYRSEKDTYLKDFNQLINSVDLNNSREESSTESFKNQPGEIKGIKDIGRGQYEINVDLLTRNPKWLPGGNEEFFLNQNSKIRSLYMTLNAKTYNCGEGADGNSTTPDVPENNSIFINKINNSNYKNRYFDIEGTSITAIYEQCLP